MTIRILLVDDNVVFLAAVKSFLQMLDGVEVVAEAHGGRQAIALALQLQPDLVLLDIAMPDLNGLEVAKAMAESLLPPRIVFLSMHDNPSYRRAAKELGAFAYVGKGDFVSDMTPILDGLINATAGHKVDQNFEQGTAL
jgi:DNA-binding NarL/FixJ family response regulator